MPATATPTEPNVTSAEYWALDRIARFHHSRDPAPSFWDVPAADLSLADRSSATRLVAKGYLIRDRRDDGVRFSLTSAGARIWKERQARPS
jgi:hypothetical protein